MRTKSSLSIAIALTITLTILLGPLSTSEASGDRTPSLLDLLVEGKPAQVENRSQAILRKSPANWLALEHYEAALRSQKKKVKQADRVDARIRALYAKHKAEGLALPDSPERLRAVIRGKKYLFVAREYYAPSDSRVKGITDFYRIEVTPIKTPSKESPAAKKPTGKSPPPLLFYLEMSSFKMMPNGRTRYHVLRETWPTGGGAQRTAYGQELPSIDQVLKDLMAHVEPSTVEGSKKTKERARKTTG